MQSSISNPPTSRTLQYAVTQSPTPPSSPSRRRPLPSTPPSHISSSRRHTTQHASKPPSRLVKMGPQELRERRTVTRLSVASSDRTVSTSFPSSPSQHVTQWPLPLPSSSFSLSAEQYWATRALAGESLHSMHLRYQGELQRAVAEQEMKREREMVTLAETVRERDRRKETFMLTLLVGTFITLLMTLHVAGRASQPPPPNKWLSTHFTIPILSPFASVVEHEASIVGTKVLSVCVLVFGAVAYATVRFWLSRPR